MSLTITNLFPSRSPYYVSFAPDSGFTSLDKVDVIIKFYNTAPPDSIGTAFNEASIQGKYKITLTDSTEFNLSPYVYDYIVDGDPEDPFSIGVELFYRKFNTGGSPPSNYRLDGYLLFTAGYHKSLSLDETVFSSFNYGIDVPINYRQSNNALLTSQPYLVVPDDYPINIYALMTNTGSSSLIESKTGFNGLGVTILSTSINVTNGTLTTRTNNTSWAKLVSCPAGTKSIVPSWLFSSYINVERFCPDKYGAHCIAFVNSYGVTDYLFFQGGKKESDSVYKSTFRSIVRSAGSVSFKSWKGSYTDFNKNSEKMITLSSGWYSEGHNAAFEELLLSERTWYFNWDGNFRRFKPVVVESSSLDYKTKAKDKMINYDITFKFAGPVMVDYNYG